MTVARYRSVTNMLMLIPVLTLFAAFMVSMYGQNNTPDPYETYDRSLPDVSAAPGTQVFDAVGYSFAIPAGFVLLPDAGGGDARMTPGAWLPTQASITLSATTVDTDTDKLSDEALEAWLRGYDALPHQPDETHELERSTAKDGSRVLTWAGCCSASQTLYTLVFKGFKVVTIVADPSDDDDHGVFVKASESIVKTLTYKP